MLRIPLCCSGIVGAAILLSSAAHAAPQSYAKRVMQDGPIGYWRLGETTASQPAADASGHGHAGAYSANGITYGIQLHQPPLPTYDTGVQFEGIYDEKLVGINLVSVPNFTELSPNYITMEAVVRWAGPNGVGQRILEKSAYAELADYNLKIGADGHIEVEIRLAGTTVDVQAKSKHVVRVEAVTHIAATFDGKRISIYLNGKLDSTTSAVGTINHDIPPREGLGIGNQISRARPFKGVIDEVALYDHALSKRRIKAHYRAL